MDYRCDIAGEIGGVRIGRQVDSHLMSIQAGLEVQMQTDSHCPAIC